MNSTKKIETVDTSKSILAKLLAQENITVEIRNASTASFDLETRLLIIPQMKSDLPESLYNLFIGHEIGHALETPTDKWESFIVAGKHSHSLTNILEDIRIEKLIKSKYPGLKRHFYEGYKILLERNFFGTKGKDLSAFKFIDRLNIHAKCGSSLIDVPFSPEEQLLVDRAFTVETWDDVVAVYDEVKGYIVDKNKSAKSFKTESKVPPTDSDQELGDSAEEGPVRGAGESSAPELDDELNNAENSEKSPDNNPNGRGNNSDDSENNEDKEDDLTSDTLEKMLENMEKLIDKREFINASIPAEIDWKGSVVPYTQYLAAIKSPTSAISIKCKDNIGPMERNYEKYQEISMPAIRHLIKGFELKKNAKQMLKVKVDKTGNLNMKKLYSYPFNDDVFKKNAVMPNGQSHGMVLFIDWSGSMSSDLDHTLAQLFNITDFCKKMKLPFDVYAFLDDDNMKKPYNLNKIPGELIVSHMRLAHLLSSSMTHEQYTTMQKYLLHSGMRNFIPNLAMGGTPLNEVILLAMHIVPDFKKKYNLQIVNTIFLTDGDSGYTRWNDDNNISMFNLDPEKRIYINDPVMNVIYEVKDNDLTGSLLTALKNRVGGNLIGFYICSYYRTDLEKTINTGKWYIKKSLSPYYIDKLLDNYSEQSFMPVKSYSYDEYYIINSKSFKFEQGLGENGEGMTDSLLAYKFSRHCMRMVHNRIMLDKFLELIV